MSPGTPRRPDPEVFRFVEACASAASDDVAATIAAVVQRVAEARGCDVALIVGDAAVDACADVLGVADGHDVCAGPWGPWLPGFVREALQTADRRKHLGIHHTPPEVVAEILDLVERTGVGPTWESVLDPAVGGGVFLLEVASRVRGDATGVVDRFWAVDIDPVAVATARAALSLWAGRQLPAAQFVVGDFLDPATVARLPDRFDLVVGNPPFLSQLKGTTSRSTAARAALRARWPGVGRYVDDAAAFLLAATDFISDHSGTVVLMQPDSLLAASDAAPVRERLMDVAPIRGLWVDRHRSFAASVDTVAVVVAAGDAVGTGVVVGAETVPTPSSGASWGGLLGAARGVPVVPRGDGPVLGSIAHITAGFRDQYYGLVDAVHDDADATHPLITVGLIDPLRNKWGSVGARFAKQRFAHPAVDLERVDAVITPWIADRLVPKVLVASQTRVLEAIVDEAGCLVPSVPVVSVEPTADAPSLWHVAALLTCPVATSYLLTDAAGTALSADSIRVSAARLGALPLPVVPDAWDVAASAAAAGDVEACGRAMLMAHRLETRPDVLDFWLARLPT